MKNQFIVFGDTHGDIDSYNMINKLCGREPCKIEYSPEKFLELADEFSKIHKHGAMACIEDDAKIKTLSLADYGDRGSDPFGIYYSFMSEAIANPDGVILLKGNHEDGYWANGSDEIETYFSPFDLSQTIKNKFGKKDGGEILRAISSKIWPNLSYSALIEGKYWFVHGGVPVFGDSCGTVATRDDIENPKRDIWYEMIWNDPAEKVENIRFGRGDVGSNYFGSEASKDILNALGAKAIIRSHEPRRVLESDHHGLVLTVGSCPNSYSGMKDGAYLLIESGSEAMYADGIIKKFGHRFAKPVPDYKRKTQSNLDRW